MQVIGSAHDTFWIVLAGICGGMGEIQGFLDFAAAPLRSE
jgi:hypothetical protein